MSSKKAFFPQYSLFVFSYFFALVHLTLLSYSTLRTNLLGGRGAARRESSVSLRLLSYPTPSCKSATVAPLALSNHQDRTLFTPARAFCELPGVLPACTQCPVFSLDSFLCCCVATVVTLPSVTQLPSSLSSKSRAPAVISHTCTDPDFSIFF